MTLPTARCPDCAGSGDANARLDGIPVGRDCATCHGSGEVTGADLLAVEYTDDEAPAYAALLVAEALTLSWSTCPRARRLAGQYQAVAAEVVPPPDVLASALTERVHRDVGRGRAVVVSRVVQ